MYTVCIDFFCCIDIIIDHKWYMIPGSDLLNLLCFLYHFFMGKFLFPKLQKGRSVFQDIFHNIGKLVPV